MSSASTDPESPKMPRARVLFACCGNTCRSFMAEYIAREKFGHIFEPSSAGFAPQKPEDAENAISTLKRLNIDASAHIPQNIHHDVDVMNFDLVVTMDNGLADRFVNEFRAFPPERLRRWKVDDPWRGDPREYERCALTIFGKLKELAKAIELA